MAVKQRWISTILGVEDVSRHFGRRRALSHVTFTAAAGTIVGLLGPNGAGKSTMMAVLATLLRPSAGQVRYGGHDAAASGAGLRASIGVLGHDLFLYPELTARENLAFFAGPARAPGRPRRRPHAALGRPASPIAATTWSRAFRVACGSASPWSAR